MSSRLSIQIPEEWQSETRYVITTLFEVFSNTPYEISTSLEKQKYLTCSFGHRTIKIPNTFFDQYYQDIKSGHLDISNIKCLTRKAQNSPPILLAPHLSNRNHVTLFGEFDIETESAEAIILKFDIIGSIFFILSRIEEWFGKTKLDDHQRFSAYSSFQHKNGLLDRPIVDEWVDNLFHLIRSFLKFEIRPNFKYKIIPTHDQDMPYKYALSPVPQLIKTIGASVIKHKKIAEPIAGLSSWIKVNTLGLKFDPENDPYHTTLKLAQLDHEKGWQSCFFYLADSRTKFDPKYSLEHPLIKLQIKYIDSFGHRIGIHPSYSSLDDFEQLQNELQEIKSALKGFAHQGTTISRQHFLRYRYPLLIKLYESTGIAESYNLGYADAPGFRAGTSNWFYPFNFTTGKAASFKEIPLILMECSVTDRQYLGLRYSNEAKNCMLKLKQTCKEMRRPFCFLWHNSRLTKPIEWSFYSALVDNS